jgi:hypothetical protein
MWLRRHVLRLNHLRWAARFTLEYQRTLDCRAWGLQPVPNPAIGTREWWTKGSVALGCFRSWSDRLAGWVGPWLCRREGTLPRTEIDSEAKPAFANRDVVTTLLEHGQFVDARKTIVAQY